MNVQEFTTRTMAKKITWWRQRKLCESTRTIRRIKRNRKKTGFDGEPAEPKRVPAKEVNREKHFHFEVRHFREKLREARHPLRLHMGEQGVAGKSALPHYY